MHFDCKCNFESEQFRKDGKDERIEKNNYCADVHLEIQPDTNQMRTISDTEHGFHEESTRLTFEATDMSFRLKYEQDDYLSIMRFDRYTSTLTEHMRSMDFQLNTIKWNTKVFRCEKVDKKY